MKLEVGKCYRTRDGRKVNVMSITSGIAKMSDGGHLFENNGKLFMDDREMDSDAVAPWDDSPVREVTRREIVPGTYGRVIVGKTYETGIWFEIADDEKGALILTAEELDNVAMIASQLAEALRDG